MMRTRSYFTTSSRVNSGMLMNLFILILFMFLNNLYNISQESQQKSSYGLVVNAQTLSSNTSAYIERLKFRRLVREYSVKTLKKLDDYVVDVKKQLRLVKIQKQVIDYATSHYLPISQRARDVALLRTNQQLQITTNTLRDSLFTRNSSELVFTKRLYDSVKDLIGVEQYIRTSTLQQQLPQSIFTGANAYVTMGKTSFVKPINISSERTFACTGEYFGLYVDPFTRKIMSFGSAALGRTNTIPMAAPIELTLSQGEFVKQMACGSEHALLLTTTSIYAWGTNTFNQVTSTNETSILLPREIVSHDNTIDFIDASFYNSVYITIDGAAFVWGKGEYYQNGNSVNDNIGTPSAIDQSIQFKKICFGRYHAIGLATTGQMYYWGSRYISANDYKVIPSISQVPKAFTNSFFSQNYQMFVDFQCGERSTMILLNSGRVYSFGYNTKGVLGDGTSIDSYDPVATLVDYIPGLRISKIRHKYYQTYGITEDQKVVSWGNNANCALGISTCLSRDGDGICNAFSCSSYFNSPTLTVPHGCENVLDLFVMRESTMILCMGNYTLSLRSVGKIYDPTFPSSYSNSYVGEFTNIYQFPLLYLSPYEKRMVTYENEDVKIVLAENQMLTLSEYHSELIVVNKSDIPNSATFQGFTNMFRAFSFYNTHDLYMNGSMWYFGGFVNNTPSDRIMRIPMDCPECAIVYNEPLAYPVGAGTVTIVDEYLYIFGGITLDRGIQIPTTKVMRAKLEDLLTWTQVSELNLPSALFDGAATLFNENIYIFGAKSTPKSLKSDIIYANMVDKKWINSNQIFPYSFTGIQLIHDASYFYILGGMDSFLTPNNKIIRASKSNPLLWEPIPSQTLGPVVLGTFSSMIKGNTIQYLSVDPSLDPQTQVSFSIYFISFTSSTSGRLRYLENAYIYLDGLKSCQVYLDELGAKSSGLYWIKPVDSVPKFVVFCDMSFLGGGWQLVASRSKSITPIYADIVYGNYDGASLNDQRWSAVRSKGTDLMLQDDTGKYAIIALSSVTGITCSPLGASLTRSELFYSEDAGCDSKGNDMCYFGSPTKNLAIAKLCSSRMIFKYWGFPATTELTNANLYVR